MSVHLPKTIDPFSSVFETFPELDRIEIDENTTLLALYFEDTDEPIYLSELSPTSQLRSLTETAYTDYLEEI